MGHLLDQPAERVGYLGRAKVVAAYSHVNVTAMVADSLRLHAKGETLFPAEAYLGWRASGGDAARYLAMPDMLPTPDGLAGSLETINAPLGNPARGLARSQSFTLLLDPDTGRPRVLMEAGYISALRTAAVSALAAGVLALPGDSTLSLLGCGVRGRGAPDAAAGGVAGADPGAAYNVVAARAKRLAELAAGRGVTGVVRNDAESYVREANVAVTVTMTNKVYVPRGWLRRGRSSVRCRCPTRCSARICCW